MRRLEQKIKERKINICYSVLCACIYMKKNKKKKTIEKNIIHKPDANITRHTPSASRRLINFSLF